MKTFVVFIAGVISLGACTNNSDSNVQDQNVASFAWELFSEEEQVELCDIYNNVEKDQIITAFMSDAGGANEETAEAYYSTMIEEC